MVRRSGGQEGKDEKGGEGGKEDKGLGGGEGYRV